MTGRRALDKEGGSAVSVTDDLLKNNEAYARSFSAGNLPLPPAKQLFVLACMDARLHVSRILGLQEGDAHVFRNAGGARPKGGNRSVRRPPPPLGTRAGIRLPPPP